jgi:hypothetical protein
MARFSDPNLPIRILDAHNKIVSKAASKQASQRFSRNVFAGLRTGFYGVTDARARANHGRFHHLYEPGATGSANSRLFRLISRNLGTEAFEISYEYLESKVPVPSGHVFRDKARVMEEGIEVNIAPINGGLLVFEIDGEQVFTSKPVVVPNPGGDLVKNALREEFMFYFRPSVLIKNPAYQAAVQAEKNKVLLELSKGGIR